MAGGCLSASTVLHGVSKGSWLTDCQLLGGGTSDPTSRYLSPHVRLLLLCLVIYCVPFMSAVGSHSPLQILFPNHPTPYKSQRVKVIFATICARPLLYSYPLILHDTMKFKVFYLCVFHFALNLRTQSSQ